MYGTSAARRAARSARAAIVRRRPLIRSRNWEGFSKTARFSVFQSGNTPLGAVVARSPDAVVARSPDRATPRRRRDLPPAHGSSTTTRNRITPGYVFSGPGSLVMYSISLSAYRRVALGEVPVPSALLGLAFVLRRDVPWINHLLTVELPRPVAHALPAAAKHIVEAPGIRSVWT